MKALGQTLAKCRKDHRITQGEVRKRLKDRYGIDVASATISHWEKDITMPSAKQFLALCEIYNLTNIYELFIGEIKDDPISCLNDEGKAKVYEYANLLIKSGLFEKPKPQILPFRRQIKKFHLKASAGTGQYLDSDAYEIIEVGDEVSTLADFGITLAGNSMEPQFINGQTVWVHQQETLNNGEIGIFYYNGDAYCKKYCEGDGCIKLISLNPGYEPIEVDEEKGFRIFGKVVG